MTPLRQRYIEDLRLKNFSPKTIKVYVHAVSRFARHFGRSPDQLSQEDVRNYLVRLMERGVARSTGVLVPMLCGTFTPTPLADRTVWRNCRVRSASSGFRWC